MIKGKYFLTGMLFGFILLIAYISSQPDGKLHLVFCDVGQGDGIYLRMPNGSDMIIDGGPNDKILSCLGKNMPFYDRTIDLVILTHPQKDHMQGLISVLERYSVKYFVIGIEGNQTEGYKKLVELVDRKKIPYKNLYSGDFFVIDKVRFNILWPDRKWIAQKFQNPNDKLQIESGKAILGISTDIDLNDFSYYVHLQHGSFDALFTGDGDSRIQDDVIDRTSLPDIDVLKFPHHGSKTGILASFLDAVDPETAVISSGKNPWGHPTKEALDLLLERNIDILRTDQMGDIEIISDGVKWNIN